MKTVFAILFFLSGTAFAASPDALLVKSMIEVSRSDVNSALANIDAVIKANPNFRLAHLIKGDLLLAHTRPISTIGNVQGAPAERLDGLREEAKARIMRYQEKAKEDLVPKYLLRLRPEQKHVVVVDISKSVLYLYQNVNGEPRYVADYYVTSGQKVGEKAKEGDKRTPVGVYFVTESLPRKTLSDFYGSGAYPISYPNEWDRHEGRKGHGIWLHGTPSDTYSRAPRASSGCVVLANADLDEISRKLQIGMTPVIIANGIEWLDKNEAKKQRENFDETMDAWKKDWESRDMNAYLSHYSKRFFSGNGDYVQWARQKSQVNEAKTWIKVGISNVSAFFYPGNEQIFVVSFDQDYQSNNLSNKMRKRQYWIKEKNDWKIIYEGEA